MTKNEAIGFIEAELDPASACVRFEAPLVDVELAFFGPVLVFRCTDSAINWRNNLWFSRKVVAYDNSASPIRVHSGFYHDYLPCREFIFSQVKSEITVIGHSLGGALATLCAVDLQYNFPSLSVSAMTFGSPRVGNKWFCSSYDRRVPLTWRYKFGGDIVCSLPPVGYRHVSHECSIGSSWIPSFSDHRLSNYRDSP